MANMRAIMPALQKAKSIKLDANGLTYASVSLPKQQRETRLVRDLVPDEIAREIVQWMAE
jgi:electron transfer flavoprotein beta subunit